MGDNQAKGPYIYHVRKNIGFLTPFLPCHCHKSADFVPFICFLGNPLPPSTADVIYGSPKKEKREMSEASEREKQNAEGPAISERLKSSDYPMELSTCRNVLSYTRHMIPNFLAFRDSPISH